MESDRGSIFKSFKRKKDASASTPPEMTFVDVSAGGNFSCGLTREGNIECWGANDKEQLNVPEETYTSISTGWLNPRLKTILLPCIDAR